MRGAAEQSAPVHRRAAYRSKRQRSYYQERSHWEQQERRPIALHDIALSAPKTASIAAIIGCDERIVEAWKQSFLLRTGEFF